MKKNLKRICIEAVMAALFVVFELISIKIGNNIKITFGGLPIVLCSVIYGPISGMIVGLLGSFIGQIISYGLSATTLLWMIPAGIRGLTMGYMFMALKKNKSVISLGACIVVSSLAVTVANTGVMYIDSIIYGYYSYAYVFGATLFRLVSSILTAVAYTIIVPVILKAINKIEA